MCSALGVQYACLRVIVSNYLFDVKLELALAMAGPALLLLGNSLACTCRKIRASLPSAGEMPFLSSRKSIVRMSSLRKVSSETIDLSWGLGELYVAESTRTLPNCLCIWLAKFTLVKDSYSRMRSA